MSVCVVTSGFQMLYVPPPGAPLNLTATGSSSSQINLAWGAATPASAPISFYTIYRQTPDGSWPHIGSSSTASFIDSALPANTPQSYYVIATDAKGAVGPASNIASATTLAPLPAAPTGLAVTGTTVSTASLSWTAVPTALSYNLYRNGTKVSSTANTIITDTGLSASTQYIYSVSAVNGGGEGPQSSTVLATTAASGTLGKFKFNPSPAYWQLDYNTSYSTQAARMAALKSKCPQTQGFEMFIPWAHLENPAIVGGAAQYDGSWATGDQTVISNQRGFTLIDSLIAAAAALGCQLMLGIHGIGGHSNGGDVSATTFPSGFAPAYLAGSAFGPNTAASNGVWGGVWLNSYAGNGVNFTMYIRYWIQAVTDRLKLFGTAYGARYDSNPNLETVAFTADEMTISAATTCTDALQLSTLTGPNGLMASWKSSFPHTQCRLWANYFQTTATMDTFLAEAVSRNWSVGGPDTCNDAPVVSSDPTLNSDGQYRSITAAYRWVGWTAAGGDGGSRDNSIPNYAGVGHAICEVEAEDTSYDAVSGTTIGNSRHLGDGILPHIVAQANRLAATHMVWFDNTFSGRAAVQTNTAHPNLCDFVSSVAQGGNVAVNGITAGIALTNRAYPPTWPQ